MCGRNTIFTPTKLAKRFKVDEKSVEKLSGVFSPSYNLAPTMMTPIVTEVDGVNHLEMMRWGFLPSFSRDPKDTFRYSTFNARSEDIFSKPTWRGAIRHHRCLVPSNGFYEWVGTPSGKQPYFIRPKSQDLFAFGGLFSYWKDSSGNLTGTYAIVTTSPSKQMEEFHNRMPLILRPKQEEVWLDNKLTESGPLEDIMRPYDSELEIYKVSRDVNSARLDNKHLIEPLVAQ